MPKRKPAPPPAFAPYAAQNPASVLGGRFGRVYVLAPSFRGVRVVERLCQGPEAQFGVRERYIPAAQLHHYAPLDPANFPLHSLLEELKKEMLLHGATPEAVMLVGAVSPFTEEELNTMAKKLETPATKKPATKAAGAKADAAPKAERAPRAPSVDPKTKITLTEKGTAKVAKGGDSGAVANLIAMKAAKTVGKALEGDLKMADINYAVKSGTITLV